MGMLWICGEAAHYGRPPCQRGLSPPSGGDWGIVTPRAAARPPMVSPACAKGVPGLRRGLRWILMFLSLRRGLRRATSLVRGRRGLCPRNRPRQGPAPSDEGAVSAYGADWGRDNDAFLSPRKVFISSKYCPRIPSRPCRRRTRRTRRCSPGSCAPRRWGPP